MSIPYIADSYERYLPEPFKNENTIELLRIFTMFDAYRWPGYVAEPECHTAWEMVYVADGAINEIAEEKVYTLKAHDVIFHKPMEFHRLWTYGEKDAHILVVTFDMHGKHAPRLRDAVFHTGEASRVLIESLFAYVSCFEKTYDKWRIRDFRTAFETREELFQSVVKQLEAFFSSLLLAGDKNLHDADKSSELLYTRIVSLLEQHVFEWISIPEIAAKVGVSPTTVKEEFKKYAGRSIHKYHLNVKMRKAIDLLQEGKTVAETSDLLGFGNPNYFSQVFKRETGYNASRYKK